MITDRAGGVLQEGRDVVHGVETADSAAAWSPAKAARASRIAPQLAGEGRYPDAPPAITAQLIHDGQFGARPAPVDAEHRFAGPGLLQLGRVRLAVPPLQRPPLGGDADGLPARRANGVGSVRLSACRGRPPGNARVHRDGAIFHYFPWRAGHYQVVGEPCGSASWHALGRFGHRPMPYGRSSPRQELDLYPSASRGVARWRAWGGGPGRCGRRGSGARLAGA